MPRSGTGSTHRLLTINVGSSSLKAVLYQVESELVAEVRVSAERVGSVNSRLRCVDATGAVLLETTRPLADHAVAVAALFDWLEAQQLLDGLQAIGQRIVHGGRHYSAPTPITQDVVDTLRALIPLDTEHLPQALAVIDAVRQSYTDVPQVACFDTAFHRQMPRVAQMFALPRDLWDAGVSRYGFHGLSYEYILEELRAIDPEAAEGRLIVAHLGNGASMVAIQHGVGIDTTMGLSPTGGLVMSTRSGDLDPGALLYVLELRKLDATALSQLVNKQSGLLGVSGTSSDMQDLLSREAEDQRAAEAVALFCYQARKFVGALAAALGGLDTLVFTAGIGERSATIRARICETLDHLGVRLDAERNAEHASIISDEASRVIVRVMPTNEDLVIARHTRRLISEGALDGHHV
jgi:acetate kinase